MGGKNSIEAPFKGLNFGVCCPGGVEIIAHSLSDTLHKHSEKALLKIDFSNAFNLIDRDWFVKESSEMFPALQRWTRWCYESPPLLLYDHSHPFFSETGAQQGDPLGPLYFCCGQHLIKKIAELEPDYQKCTWMMEGSVGSVELLQKVWKLLESEGPKIGLFLNPAKCEWSWLNPAKPDPCPIPGVELVPTDKITMLGVPLGSNEFVSKYVDQELVAAAKKFMKELSDFEDTQIGLYLLRISFGIVRAVHFMRTTPFNQWAKQAGLSQDHSHLAD